MIAAGAYDLLSLVGEAGITCSRCGSGACGRSHGVRRRKAIRDLETGRLHKNVPIVRVEFCDGGTCSLPPAAVWRGRSTVRSVLAAVDRVVGERVEATLAWATQRDGEGEEPVSERTLRRWRRQLETRLLGDPARWVAARLGDPTLTTDPVRLPGEALRLPPADLLAFRARFGRALPDTVTRPTSAARSPSRRVPGRLAPAPPPDPPSSYHRRGRSSPRPGREGRGPPGNDPSEEELP